MSIVTLFIIGTTVVASFMAFNNRNLFNDLAFYPYSIWRNNEWHRLITGGFIHADATHLFFNMFALFSFGGTIEDSFDVLFESKGKFIYVLFYLAALVVSDLYNLFTKKNDSYFHSIGASGAVSAIIFASILINPYSSIYIMFIPVGIPAFIFGPLYLLFSSYMARRGGDNVDHVAHFSGSVFGFFFPVLLHPQLLARFINLITKGH